jgi:hypothetical protein
MRRSHLLALTGVLVMLVTSIEARAQNKPKPKPQAEDVPTSHLPPPGLCRIWLNDVPAAQQPAPTDCASAVRNRPRNGRVIFNDKETPNAARLPVKSLQQPASKDSKTANPPKPDPKPRKPDRDEGSES